jgi:hypothetical protein
MPVALFLAALLLLCPAATVGAESTLSLRARSARLRPQERRMRRRSRRRSSSDAAAWRRVRFNLSDTGSASRRYALTSAWRCRLSPVARVRSAARGLHVLRNGLAQCCACAPAVLELRTVEAWKRCVGPGHGQGRPGSSRAEEGVLVLRGGGAAPHQPGSRSSLAAEEATGWTDATSICAGSAASAARSARSRSRTPARSGPQPASSSGRAAAQQR